MSQINVSAQVTNGSPNVLITGDYTASIHQHHIFMVGPSYAPYFVSAEPTYSSGTGKTTVVLTGNWTGSSGTVAAIIVADFTYPDRIPTLRAGDVGTATIFTQAMLRVQELFSAIASSGIENATAQAAAAVASAAAASTSASAASGSASAASASASAASTSASNAATSETNAATSASNAATTYGNVASAVSAGVSDINAAKATALSDIAADVAAADADRVLAQKWASEAVNVVVADGKYSAYHWAQQAAASVTGVMVYRGLWDASGGSYPVGPASGDYYRVSVAGTVSGTAYNVGDGALYNGTGWVRFGNDLDTSALLTKSGNLSGLTDLAAARSALGLGTAATQASSTFATAAQGTAADNALPKAGGTMTGDITSSGTGRRLKGDFSSATIADRMMGLTSTTDAKTVFGVLPNGTGAGAGFAAYSGSDLDNVQFIELFADKDAVAYLKTSKIGSAVQQDLAFIMGSTEAMRLSDAGRVLIGQTVDDDANKLQVTGPVKLTDTGAGGIVLSLLGNGATTPGKGIRVKDGALDILNNAGSGVLLKIADDGKITLSNDVAFATKNITGLRNQVFDSELDLGNGGTGKTIDIGAARFQKLTLSAASCTLTFTAPSVDGVYMTCLRLAQDVTGGRSVTYPGGIYWASNSAPYLETLATRSTEVYIKAVRLSGTTTYFGSSIAF